MRCFSSLAITICFPFVLLSGLWARWLCECWSTAFQERKKEPCFVIGQCALLRSLYAVRETRADVTLCYYWTCGEFCVVKETVRGWHYCHFSFFLLHEPPFPSHRGGCSHARIWHTSFLIFKTHLEIRNPPRGRRVLPVKNFPSLLDSGFSLAANKKCGGITE